MNLIIISNSSLEMCEGMTIDYVELEKNKFKILKLQSPYIEKAISDSCKIKRNIVQLDEKEKNIRKVLNLGHTFAHAYEATLRYSGKLNHGEAVILGINSAVKFSLQNKRLNKNIHDQIW